MSADRARTAGEDPAGTGGPAMPPAAGAPGDEGGELEPFLGDPESRLALSDLLNHVLDRGVVLLGDVTIGVADIDLIRLRLSVLLASVAALEQRERDAGLPVLPPSGGE